MTRQQGGARACAPMDEGMGERRRCIQPWTGAEAAGMEERARMMAVGGEEHGHVQVVGSASHN